MNLLKTVKTEEKINFKNRINPAFKAVLYFILFSKIIKFGNIWLLHINNYN